MYYIALVNTGVWLMMLIATLPTPVASVMVGAIAWPLLALVLYEERKTAREG